MVGDRTVIDSERVVLVHRPGRPPAYAFPERDVHGDVPASPEPAVPGYAQVSWDAMTAWYEEEEQVVGNPRNPYHRVDCLRVRRRLRVEVAGTILVDTTETVALYETSRAPQLYVKRDAVRMGALVASATRTYCPYKGIASYWSARVGDAFVEDVAWSYDEPTPESGPIAGLLSFYADRTNMLQDVPRGFEVPTCEEPAPETP
jgi:uncharacterized protein (DUF427 family)